MKSLFLVLVFAAGNAFAAFDLKDKAILGSCSATDKNSELSEIEIKYSLDNQLVLVFDSSDDRTFALETMGADGVIVDSDVSDECDDPGCGYWTYVKVTLASQKTKGKTVPKLVVELTKYYGFPEEEGDREGDVTTTNEFLWTAPLKNEVPLILNAKTPVALEKALSTCYAAVKGTVVPARAICPEVQVFSYKNSPDFDTAWAALAEERHGSADTQVSFANLEATLYARIEATILGLELDKGAKDTTDYSAMLNGIQQVKDYVHARGDRLYISTWLDSSTLYVVDESKKAIIILSYNSF